MDERPLFSERCDGIMTAFDLQRMESDKIVHLFWRTNLKEAFLLCTISCFDLEDQYLVCHEHLTFNVC